MDKAPPNIFVYATITAMRFGGAITCTWTEYEDYKFLSTSYWRYYDGRYRAYQDYMVHPVSYNNIDTGTQPISSANLCLKRCK